MVACAAKNVPDRFGYVFVDEIQSVHARKGLILATESILVIHIDGDVLKQDGAIEEQKKSACYCKRVMYSNSCLNDCN